MPIACTGAGGGIRLLAVELRARARELDGRWLMPTLTNTGTLLAPP